MKIISTISSSDDYVVKDISNQTFYRFPSSDQDQSFNGSRIIDPIVGLPIALQKDLVNHWITKRDLQEELKKLKE